MTPQFLDGTVTFREVKDAARGWYFDLETRFSDDVGPNIHVRKLERLQGACHGDIHVERTNEGHPFLKLRVVSHGAESAINFATNFANQLQDFLELPNGLNVACSH